MGLHWSNIQKSVLLHVTFTATPYASAADTDHVQTPATTGANAYESSTVINLKPLPFDRSEPFDEDELFIKPIAPPKNVNTAPINAKFFSVADLQIATDSFNVENLIGEGSIGCVYKAQTNDGKVFYSVYSRMKTNLPTA